MPQAELQRVKAQQQFHQSSQTHLDAWLDHKLPLILLVTQPHLCLQTRAPQTDLSWARFFKSLSHVN